METSASFWRSRGKVFFFQNFVRLFFDHLYCLRYAMPRKVKYKPRLIPSVKYLETLAKILDFPAKSRLLLKPLIRSCLFLLDTKLLKFLIGILVRVLSRVSRK